MCGILGILQASKKLDFSRAETALSKIAHRGPDFQQCERISENLIFGHARLSIIDKSEVSNQPFHSKDGRYSMVFNGELYNYIELKEELIKQGQIFYTSGDTEVLLNAFIQYGPDCVSHFNGMWAFAIYDNQTKQLFCSRDRFGVKPFLYHHTEDIFIFASEAKAILSYMPSLNEPNYPVIANYVRNSYGAQGSDTWFLQIQRLLPGHSMFVDREKVNIWRYYEYPNAELNINYSDACAQYRALFIDAVKLRMRSDVPVGTTLSSGVDSSSVVTAIRTFFQGNHHTFTAYFKQNPIRKGLYKDLSEISEEKTVEKLEKDLNLNSTYVLVDNEHYLQRLTKIIYALEGGHSSTAIVPIEQIYARAKKEVTVVLEGQGADELLGGYITSVIFESILSNISTLKFKSAYSNLIGFLKYYKLLYTLKLLVRQNLPNSLLELVYKITGQESVLGSKLKGHKILSDSFSPAPKEYSILKKKLFKSHSGGLIDLLHYGDILSMQHGVEGRNPFLDYRLVEFVFRLPDEFFVRNGEGKMLHKDAMRDLLPPYILENVHKVGFATPINGLFEADNPFGVLDYLNSKNKQELFSTKKINQLISKHQNGQNDHSRQLFRILSTLIWFDIFIDKA